MWVVYFSAGDDKRQSQFWRIVTYTLCGIDDAEVKRAGTGEDNPESRSSYSRRRCTGSWATGLSLLGAILARGPVDAQPVGAIQSALICRSTAWVMYLAGPRRFPRSCNQWKDSAYSIESRAKVGLRALC